jgi:membrane protease YdiL (CAAX protease family)
LAFDTNPLIQNDLRPIRWWSIALFAVILPALLVPGAWLLREHGMLAMLALFFCSSLVAVGLAVAPLGGHALSALGFRPAGWRPVVLGTLGALVISVAVTRLGIEPEGMKEAMKIAAEPAQFAASVAVMAILAPLVEETVFRGLLYGWIAGRWGTIAAWIVSSILFAAAHVELAHAVLVFPLGLWFGWLRRRTDSLWPSIVAHMINNGIAVLAAGLLDNASP